MSSAGQSGARRQRLDAIHRLIWPVLPWPAAMLLLAERKEFEMVPGIAERERLAINDQRANWLDGAIIRRRSSDVAQVGRATSDLGPALWRFTDIHIRKVKESAARLVRVPVQAAPAPRAPRATGNT